MHSPDGVHLVLTILWTVLLKWSYNSVLRCHLSLSVVDPIVMPTMKCLEAQCGVNVGLKRSTME